MQKKRDYTLNDAEKNTLFKSSVKSILSFGRDSQRAWQQLSIFCGANACNVNIFEFKDALHHGVEYRLAKGWPIKIKRERELTSWFKPFASEEMKRDNINVTSLLFKKIVSSNLVYDIITRSIFSVEAILGVDS